MTGIEKLERQRVREKDLETTIDRIAIEHALREAFGDEAWGEVQVEYVGSGARLWIAGHVPILAHMEIGEGGIGWELIYGVGQLDDRTFQFEWNLADALIYAASLNERQGVRQLRVV